MVCCRTSDNAMPAAIYLSLPRLIIPSPILFYFTQNVNFFCIFLLMRSYSPGPVLVSLIPFSLFCCCVDFVAAICYYPDRSLSPQDVPCSDSEGESNCCGPGYACLSNKVCRQAHRDDNGNIIKYTYGRGSCTDRNWRSSACPSFCILGLSGKSPLF